MKILYINSSAYDYLTATLVEGLLALGCDLVASEPSNYARKIPDEHLSAFAEQADLIVVGSNVGVRTDLVRPVRNPRKVFVDGSDFQLIDPPSDIAFKIVFKRELGCRYPDPASAFVFPLPFAAETRYFDGDSAQKNVLVSFLANFGTNPMRFSIHQRLENLGDPMVVSGFTGERAYIDPPHPLPLATPLYRQVLHRSLISVSVPGIGYDCARFWEILAARAMLLTYEPDIVIPNGFTDGIDCVSFRSLDQFDEKLAYYAPRHDLAAAIAQRGHERLLAHHTTQARARYFLDIVRRHIDRAGSWQPPVRPPRTV